MLLRRVKKEESISTAFVKPDGLATCLDCWKTWMLSDDRDLSASRMKLGGGADEEPVGYESDVYAEQRKADIAVGAATGAMIDSLKPAWRWAIYKKCSISTQWKFPQLNFLDVLAAAEADLENKLRKNIATATQF